MDNNGDLKACGETWIRIGDTKHYYRDYIYTITNRYEMMTYMRKYYYAYKNGKTAILLLDNKYVQVKNAGRFVHPIKC